MEFTEVKSSNIQGVAHNGVDMFVKFQNGGVYKYCNVPLFKYNEFLDSDSKGKYFASEIKNNFETHKEE